MFRTIKSCLGTLVTGAILIAAAYGGWRWGDRVFPTLEQWIGIERAETDAQEGASPALGQVAMARLDRLDEAGDQ